MSRPSHSFAAIGAGVVVAGAALLVVVGPPRDRRVAVPPPPPEIAHVTAGGVTLAAVSAELPADDVALPPGPGRDAVERNCTSCHSPAMIVSQPALTRAQWQATVDKMRTVYRAPIDDADMPAILTYLTGLGAPVPARR